MSKTTKFIAGIIILILIIVFVVILIKNNNSTGSPGIPPTTPTTPSSAQVTPSPSIQQSPTLSSDSSNSSLNQDLSTINGQMNVLASDSANTTASNQ